jgi:hypothetical protein
MSRSSPLSDVSLPFRWDLGRSEQLGSLLHGQVAEAYPQFTQDLLQVGVDCLAMSSNADLYFVGRSPDSVYDYLCGISARSWWRSRLHALPFSCYYSDAETIQKQYPNRYQGLIRYFAQLGILPAQILARPRAIALVDLVSQGRTMENLLDLLYLIARDSKITWEAVRNKIVIIGFISPLHRSGRKRGHQQTIVERIRHPRVRLLVTPERFWCYIGNEQPKIAASFTPECWEGTKRLKPRYEATTMEALRLEHAVYQLGLNQQQRYLFASGMGRSQSMGYRWFRELKSTLRDHR